MNTPTRSAAILCANSDEISPPAGQVLANVEGCLRAAGVGKVHLVVRVYVTGVARWPEFNRLR
jgi:hypothetical protein